MTMNNKFPPIQKWRLDEIQDMLNQIEGYENVMIEFQYAPSDGWNSDHYDCKCGIRERNVEGWLLKYEFQVNDKLELADVRLAAFQEMATRLVTDVWRTSINSFRNEQKQLNKIKHSYSDPLPTKTLNEILPKAEQAANNLEQQINKTNITDKITNTTNKNKTTNNIQANMMRLLKSFLVTGVVCCIVAVVGLVITLCAAYPLTVLPTVLFISLWFMLYKYIEMHYE